MKKTIILFLIAILLFGAQGYCAPTDEIVIYENNFDRYSKDESFIGGAFKTKGTSVNTADYAPLEGGAGIDYNNKVLKFGNPSQEGGFVFDLKEIPATLNGKFTVSFDAYFSIVTRSVRIPEFWQGNTQAFEAICTSSMVGLSTEKGSSTYMTEKAKAKHWYNIAISVDMDKKIFSVSYDGKKVPNSDGTEVFSYEQDISYIDKLIFKYMAKSAEAYTYIDNLKIVKYIEPDLNVSDIIFSDDFKITLNTVLGVTNNMTAEDVISSLEYDEGTDLKIYTQNGIERKGALRAGDYLIATGEKTQRFSFPDLSLNSLYSDTFKIDTKNFDITGIAEGLTADTLIKSLKGAESFEFSVADYLGTEKLLTDKIVSGDILMVKISDEESYNFELKKIPAEGYIIADDFDGENLENWFNSGGGLRRNSKNAYIENGGLKITDAGTYDNVIRRFVPEQNGVFIVEQSAVYNYDSSVSHESSFRTPVFSNSEDVYARVINKNGKLYYKDISSITSTEVYTGKTIENGRKYYQKLIVDLENNCYSIYLDGELVVDKFEMSSPLSMVNRLEYNYHNSGRNTDKGNYMVIDDLRVYNPRPVLGAVLYDNDKKIELIYSENTYEYPDISSNDVTIEDGLGNSIDFSFSINENICSLTLIDKLKDGVYKVTVQDKPCYITVGNAPYEINYVYASDSKCEFSLRNRTEDDKTAQLYAVLYNSENKIAGVASKDVLIPGASTVESTISLTSTKNDVSFVKLFLWDDVNKFVPLSKAYVYEFNE